MLDVFISCVPSCACQVASAEEETYASNVGSEKRDDGVGRGQSGGPAPGAKTILGGGATQRSNDSLAGVGSRSTL